MTHQQARREAERCLTCFDAPCTAACPVRIDIPGFIGMVKTGNLRGAAEVVKTSNALANVCGRICPEEVFCQSVCNRGKLDIPIAIRELHLHATEYEAKYGYSYTMLSPSPAAGSQKLVAVIGGGPAGLGCAFELSKLGCSVHVYEKEEAGGVPAHSIPTFRLPDETLQSDMRFLLPHFLVKRTAVGEELFSRICREYDAVFVAVGLGRDKPLTIPGETLEGVYPVLQFLEAARRGDHIQGIGGSVVVVGGGNVSLDAAAAAQRLGASSVILLYRRSDVEMKVWKSELEEARRCGVEIRFLTVPVEITGEKTVQSVRCRRTRLSKEPDSSGRRFPIEVEGSDFVLACEAVIIAIGQEISAPFVKSFAHTGAGFVRIGEHFGTSIPGVFAGGDAVAGEGTIVQAVAHGKAAADAIVSYLKRSPEGRP